MEICEEMKKLRKSLTDKGIDWKDNSTNFDDEFSVCRTQFIHNDKLYSVINGLSSMGGCNFLTKKNDGLLELFIMNEFEEPKGYLTAEDVLEYVN